MNNFFFFKLLRSIFRVEVLKYTKNIDIAMLRTVTC